jgi:uncharacterized protein YjeT (DUF2065 family)
MNVFVGNVIGPAAWEEYLTSLIGLTQSQLRFTAAFLLSVPVGAFYRWLPNAKGYKFF